MSAAPLPKRAFRIAVIGAAAASEEDYLCAQRLGVALAEAGAVVLCGGHGGVMEGVARGASGAGGLVIGILRGDEPGDANPWISIPLATGLGDARNALVVRGAEAVVAVGGAWGTLSEIALARRMGRSVGILGTPPADGLGLTELSGPSEAATWALEQAHIHRGETYSPASGTSRREP